MWFNHVILFPFLVELCALLNAVASLYWNLRSIHEILHFQLSLELFSYQYWIFVMQMDNSPTTGSVNTTDAEKARLAKASLAFNCKK